MYFSLRGSARWSECVATFLECFSAKLSVELLSLLILCFTSLTDTLGGAGGGGMAVWYEDLITKHYLSCKEGLKFYVGMH